MTYRQKLLSVALIILSFFTVQTAYAATNQVQEVIDETYVQPDYVLGYSLSPEQENQTLALLNYNKAKDNRLKKLDTSSFARIMNVADDPSLQLHSSVKIQKLGARETLQVKIVTPENITKVTQDMYRNAAVTLGIEHAKITVAAPLAVTGESALAGIYYSLEANGAQIPEENKALAQEELATLSGINQENAGKQGYDADKLNVALTDIKAAVAKAGSEVTEEKVRQIVTDTLDQYCLSQSVTGDQVNLIINFALNLSNSGIISNANFTKTLQSLKDSIVAKAGSTFKGINLNIDTNQAVETSKGIWQQKEPMLKARRPSLSNVTQPFY
ncbi:DUF1002 domain-containing protein [Streptococcus ictaluri]|nr:DUF1002 domain-containing protein [Streptococcus ictaluri]